MSQSLASDLNNPEFAGAINPDSRLAVRFYSRPVKHEVESNTQGRPIFFDADYVEIFVPGDPTTIVDTPVREDHKRRFPLQWSHYQNTHGDTKEIGTPLAQWPRLTASQVEEMKALKFFTVEAVANATDASLQRIGMVAGMSPFVFRQHAQRFLSVAKGDAAVQKAQEDAETASKRVQELEAANEKMKSDFEHQMEEMRALVAQATAPKKRGPKSKLEA